MRVENCRQFGGPWLALELIKRLGLHEFLRRTMPAGTGARSLVADRADPGHRAALRAVERTPHRRTLLPAERAGRPVGRVRWTRWTTIACTAGWTSCCRTSEALEAFLKQRFGELFAIEYDLLLYDVTSTYFEGQANANPLAKRGYSRDHRSDCKQVCIGLVVTRCGLPLGYEVFAGNRHDSTTLEEIVETMEARYGQAQRDLGVGSRHGLGRQPRLPQSGAAAVHRGDAQEPTQAIRAAVGGARLARDPRGIGGQVVPVSRRWRRDLHSLSQSRSP